jgi:hypothetical protein
MKRRQISMLLDMRGWETRNDDARAADQRGMNEQLLQLESDHQQLKETLSKLPQMNMLKIRLNISHTDVDHNNIMAMIVSLQRSLHNRSGSDQEQQFFSHTLQYLTTISGHGVKLENWMITSYEVELGPQIGSGGLWVLCTSQSSLRTTYGSYIHCSGQVFKGTWNETEVAVKVLTIEPGITPSSAVSPRFSLYMVS